MQKQGVANNNYRVTKFGITLFFSNEDYILDPNGSDVTVRPNERFGPIPFLFRENDPYRAIIHAQGMSSTYYIILLSDHWIGQYQVAPPRPFKSLENSYEFSDFNMPSIALRPKKGCFSRLTLARTSRILILPQNLQYGVRIIDNLGPGGAGIKYLATLHGIFPNLKNKYL